MTGFAGSRSLDERRRRRLAAGDSPLQTAPVSIAKRLSEPKGFSRQRGPGLLCGLIALPVLHRNMRGCRLSSVLLWQAALLGIALAGLVLARPLSLPALRARLLECGVAMLCGLSLVSSMLLHARSVLYFSAEPPDDRPSKLWSLVRRGLIRLKRGLAWRQSGQSNGAAVA